MNDADKKLVNESFKKYYLKHPELIRVPKSPKRREFGYQTFEYGMTRHISIKDDNELRLLLMERNTSDVYCSNGYYLFPNLPMKDKDWQGADLIFDIDAKDLNLDCRKKHTCIKCSQCNKIFTELDSCPDCKSTKTRTISVACKNCIDMSKKQVVKLLEILSDLGITDDINIYFSGNEGFHIYIYDTPFNKFDSRQRLELSNYITFNGAIPETFGIYSKKIVKKDIVDFDQKGWKGRVAKHIFGSKSKRSKIITELTSQGYTSFQNKLKQISNDIGAQIDSNVTTDIHRVFRLAGSLNSKSGLTKMQCQEFDSFDPYDKACLLDDDPIDIISTCPVKFKLRKRNFGPYDSKKITVPRYAAVYLICKGLATCI